MLGQRLCGGGAGTSLQSRTMGCVTLNSCWLPSTALLVLLLRAWPFLKGTLGPAGSSLQGDVGEVDSTRVFRAATSAWSTSICRRTASCVFVGAGGATFQHTSMLLLRVNKAVTYIP